jgi:hypothetical protein
MSRRVRVTAVVTAAALALSVSGCDRTSKKPNPTVERINAETDCGQLQTEFDTAERNGHTDYMQVADKRMRALGCYD